MMGLRSWVRTLNLDDAHVLIAAATPGITHDLWATTCMGQLHSGASEQRQKELLRIVREHFLAWDHGQLLKNFFLTFYAGAPAPAQREMVNAVWALTHPITLIAAEDLVGIALKRGFERIALEDVDRFCEKHLETTSAESIRKTRTTLIGALEGVGCLVPRGTGRHRTLWPTRAKPDPRTFSYLILREMEEESAPSFSTAHVINESVAARLTQCGPEHANYCLGWATHANLLKKRGRTVRAALGGT